MNNKHYDDRLISITGYIFTPSNNGPSMPPEAQLIIQSDKLDTGFSISYTGPSKIDKMSGELSTSSKSDLNPYQIDRMNEGLSTLQRIDLKNSQLQMFHPHKMYYIDPSRSHPLYQGQDYFYCESVNCKQENKLFIKTKAMHCPKCCFDICLDCYLKWDQSKDNTNIRYRMLYTKGKKDYTFILDRTENKVFRHFFKTEVMSNSSKFLSKNGTISKDQYLNLLTLASRLHQDLGSSQEQGKEKLEINNQSLTFVFSYLCGIFGMSRSIVVKTLTEPKRQDYPFILIKLDKDETSYFDVKTRIFHSQNSFDNFTIGNNIDEELIELSYAYVNHSNESISKRKRSSSTED